MKSLNIIAGILFFVLSVNVVYSQSNHAVKTETIALQGNQVFPEGIINLPNNNLLVGGFGDGSIQTIDEKGNVSYFSKPGENGMVIAVGFAIDKKNNRLWVANFNFKTVSGNPGSQFKVFDYTTGKLLKTIPEKFIEGAFFNEVILDEKGNAYVSNTFGPNLYAASFESTDANVFVTNELLKNPSPEQPFGLNGLTITPDYKYLIASVMNRTIKGGGRLVKVDIITKEVTPIKLKNDEAAASFSGSDGMFFYKGELLMVNVYSSAGAIFSAKFNKDYSEASLTIRNKFQGEYDRPTASAIRNGKLYTVNSQLNHIIDDKDGKLNTPPVLPFKVVGVPLAELLK
jgi:WD40 repeat protein